MAERRALGPILRAARQRVRLTQSELAYRVGLAPNHVARLESGEKGVPRFDTVARLASQLGLSLDDLSRACGYTEATKVGSKDRTAIAQCANELAKVREAVESVDKRLTSAIGSLQRQAGIPHEPAGGTRRKRRS